MTREINIDLDVATVPVGTAREEVSRLALVTACGYTRDGGAPTITNDCTSYSTLKGEAQRLKTEIDAALARARDHYGDAEPATESRHARPSPGAEAAGATAAGGARPRIDSRLCVRDVMTVDVRTVGPNDTLSVAEELMSAGRFRHAVVLDEDHAVCGVISRRDIFHGALAWALGQGRTAHQKTLESTPIKQVMETTVVTIDPDLPIGEAAATMIERKIGCLPVLVGAELVGILTEGDFLALLTSS